MADNKDLEAVAKTATDDFYELLGVAFDAEESDIKRAYRKASIKVHPDKNPDDLAAADKFIRLGIARDILSDVELKGEYDRQRQRKRERALQDELLSDKRRKMKEDLERRETATMTTAKRKREGFMTKDDHVQEEVDRLREVNKRKRAEFEEKRAKERLEEEASFMERSPEAEARPQAPAPAQTAEIDRTIKVRYFRNGEESDGTDETIIAKFYNYGEIDEVVQAKDRKIRVAGEKHRRVIATVFLVYKKQYHAHAAVLDGKSDCAALESVTWAGKEPEIKSPVTGEFSASSTPISTPNKAFRASFTGGLNKGFGSAPGTPKFSFSPNTHSLEDVTMMRLKQAEKKRLEEQIRKQEAAEEATALP